MRRRHGPTSSFAVMNAANLTFYTRRGRRTERETLNLYNQRVRFPCPGPFDVPRIENYTNGGENRQRHRQSISCIRSNCLRDGRHQNPSNRSGRSDVPHHGTLYRSDPPHLGFNYFTCGFEPRILEKVETTNVCTTGLAIERMLMDPMANWANVMGSRP